MASRARPSPASPLLDLPGPCVVLFLVPSSIGENIARIRFVAIPIAVLALSLRSWRPRRVALPVLALAISWNLSPLAASAAQGLHNPAASASYWGPAIVYLRSHLSPSYRVEAVDTTGHWPAVYLARAGIPLTRGWYRQNHFPVNQLLYRSGHLGRIAYVRWLRSLGVRYVVASRASPDYSSRAEWGLIRSGKSRLRILFRNPNLDVLEVPSPRPIVVGPGNPEVLNIGTSSLLLRLRVRAPIGSRCGIRRTGRPRRMCVSRSPDGMVRLHAPRRGVVKLRFLVRRRRRRSQRSQVSRRPGCAG